MQILLYSFILLGDALRTFVLPERTIPPCRQPAFEEEEEEEEEPVTSGHQVAQVIVQLQFTVTDKSKRSTSKSGAKTKVSKIETKNKEFPFTFETI